MAGCWVVLVVAAFGVALAISTIARRPVDQDGLPVLGTLGDLALMAYTLVVVWLARRGRIARRSPAGPDVSGPVSASAHPAAPVG
ncbi:MAG TPA: hypothetical protein VFH03_24235 [Actinoplanes sp.]|nr:hypothetical protein [Actinoplanes sp.]